jgi:hypothetical protein
MGTKNKMLRVFTLYFQPNSVTVVDNSPYHNTEKEKAPSTYSKKWA